MRGRKNPGGLGGCPDAARWLAVASGGVRDAEAGVLLDHAGSCASCAEKLREAISTLTDETNSPGEDFFKALRTSQPEWQRETARRLAADWPRRHSFRPRRLAWAAVAATLLAGIGFWYWEHTHGPPLAELARAYSSSRTIDLRIPGAAHAPLTVERSRAVNRSPQLLESEAAIERRLLSHPDDWTWLHARGRAQLLEWQYDESIRNLRSAMDLSGASSGPRYAEMLVDLATAYYERAQAGQRPIDYSAAIEYLSKAIQLYPSLPVAYFNRAIVFEKKFDYFHAIEDWKRYLALDPQGTWSEEAHARLAELEHKMGAARRDDPARLNDLIEYRLETAMRSGMIDFETSSALARQMSLENRDGWLTDALAVREHPAVNVLAAMVESRSVLRISQFPTDSGRLANLRPASLPPPLRVWLAFETLFRASHSPAVAFEPAGIASVVAVAQDHGYWWLLGQILLERSSSRMVQARWEDASATHAQVRQMAGQHRFPLLEMRAAGFLDIQFAETGRYREAAQIENQELSRFWQRASPWLRGEVYYAGAAWQEEALGRLHAAMYSADAAARTAALAGARETEAVNLARSAGFAESAGDSSHAQPLLQRSQQIFSQLPLNRNTEDYRTFAECEYSLGSSDGGLAGRLESASRNSSNPFVKVTALRTLAVLDERQDHWQRAEARLRQAILALLPVNTSTPLADRLRWQMELSRNYRELVNILLHENRIRDAFAVWQNYLRAGALVLNGRLDALPPAGAFRGDVLTFARLATRYGIWHQNGNDIEFAWLDGSSEGIDRLARRYAALCSRPDSSKDQIYATGKELHRSFGPLFDQALAHGSLIVQPDGELGRIAWTSLPVSPTAVVADRAAVSICPLPLLAETPLSHIDLSHTLAVAADAIAPARAAEFRPLPGIDSELSAVTGAASRCVVLRGTAATAANIEQNLSSTTTLHFAGHAVTSSQMVSLLVAPGADSLGGTADTWRPQAASCRKLALAVFGACSTARYDEMETVAPQNLPQLFLLAGTQHVIASLWDVDSLLVSEFMKKLYSQIRSGIAIEAAMRQSMASIREKKGWESPYYWASFALFTR